jgi:hypothetical protein
MDLEEAEGEWTDDHSRHDFVTSNHALPHHGANGTNGHTAYNLYPPPPILHEDILLIVLDVLLDRNESRNCKSIELISVDRKVNLSQESFNLPSTELTSVETIGNFRLVCRAFNWIGARYLFPRVTTRFSKHGLERLENIAKSPILSKCVLKFSYMVPCFFEKGLSVEIRQTMSFDGPQTKTN